MPKSSVNKILSLIISINIVAIVFLTPLFFAYILKTNNVFELNKIVLFQILVLLLLFFTFFKNFISGKYLRIVLLSNYIIIFFIAFLFLSFIFSIDLKLSFVGLYERQQGLETYLYIVVFFFLLLINIKDKQGINKIIWSAVLSSFLVSVYGLIQATGYDFIIWSESTQLRATSTFGQPNHLGSFLILTLPLGAYLLVKAKKIFTKIIIFIIAIVQILALYSSYSSSAWLGLLGGGLVVVLLYFILATSKRSKDLLEVVSKRNKYIALLLFVVAIFIFISFSNSWVLKSKISNLITIQSGSSSARLQFWQASIKAIKERPIFGYGLETQGEVLVKYYLPEWAVPNNVNVQPIRAHNMWLDILLTQGLVGLIAWGALLYLFYSLIIRNIRQNKEKWINYAVFWSLTSYLIFLQFQYHNITALVYFWIFLAIVIIINKTKTVNSDVVSERQRLIQANINNIAKQNKKPSKIILIIKLILIILAGIGVFYQINKEIRKITADHYFLEIRESRLYNQYFSAIDLFNFIKENIPEYSYYDREFANIMADWLDNFTDPRFRKYGEEKLAAILDNTPDNNYANLFTRAKIYTALANEKNVDNYKLAEENFTKLIAYSPEMPRNYYELAKMYNKKSEHNSAINNFIQALTKLPNLDHPYLNQDHEKAIEQEMVKNYIGLGDAYLKLTDYQEAGIYYQKALELWPKYVLIYNKIAMLYIELDDYNKALEYATKAQEISPEDRQVEYLISEIKQNLNESE